MEYKSPGTLYEWVKLYKEQGWTDTLEQQLIVEYFLENFGPDALQAVIDQASDLLKDFEEEYSREGIHEELLPLTQDARDAFWEER